MRDLWCPFVQVAITETELGEVVVTNRGNICKPDAPEIDPCCCTCIESQCAVWYCIEGTGYCGLTERRKNK